MNVCTNKSNLYIDFQPVKNIKSFLESNKAECLIDQSPKKDYIQFFHDLHCYEEDYGYKRVKYRNRQAVSIEILLPSTIKQEDIKSFVKKFMKDLLSECALAWVAFVEQRGKGRFIKILIAERKYLEEGREVKRFAESDAYRSINNGRYCDPKDEGAYLVQKQGDLLKSWRSNWSDKYRIFLFHNKFVFNIFIDRMRRILVTNMITLNVEFKKRNFFKGIKRILGYSKVRQQNITEYNTFIAYMNSKLVEMEVMVYSPAKYSQEQKNIDRMNSLFYKYQARLKKKEFSYDAGNKKIPLTISIFKRFDIFRNNFETFKEQFEADYIKTWELITQ